MTSTCRLSVLHRVPRSQLVDLLDVLGADRVNLSKKYDHPETLLVSRQAKQMAFNPKFFFVSVGTAFPLYREEIGPGYEGVIGMDSWNAKSSAGAKAYFDAHTRRFGKQPDRWASGHTWASLEFLTQAVARTGMDRQAIRDVIAKSTFQTIIGPIRFSGSENQSTLGSVGQRQSGEFEVVWPRTMSTSSLVAPKPAWR